MISSWNSIEIFKMNFKLILVGCILASIAITQVSWNIFPLPVAAINIFYNYLMDIFEQIAANCLCGAEGEDVCSCSLTRVPRPQQLPRFQSRPVQRQNKCTCSSSSSENRQQFNPIGDRCSCGNSAVLPAVRPPCSCQVRQDNNSRNNNIVPRVRGRSGLLGLFGLRGVLSGVNGISLNTRLLPRTSTNVNSIVREPVNRRDDCNESITT